MNIQLKKLNLKKFFFTSTYNVCPMVIALMMFAFDWVECVAMADKMSTIVIVVAGQSLLSI